MDSELVRALRRCMECLDSELSGHGRTLEAYRLGEAALAAHDAREGGPWWAGRVSEIEDAIAAHKMDAAAVFTQMRALLAAQPQPSAADDFLLVRKSDLIGQDSYGVHGSEFDYCRVCGCESGAGMLNKGIMHAEDCPLAAAPQPQEKP